MLDQYFGVCLVFEIILTFPFLSIKFVRYYSEESQN